MSNSVQPRRRQPTRLPRPWDSPGKNAGVGCHFLLQCMKVKSESEVAIVNLYFLLYFLALEFLLSSFMQFPFLSCYFLSLYSLTLYFLLILIFFTSFDIFIIFTLRSFLLNTMPRYTWFLFILIIHFSLCVLLFPVSLHFQEFLVENCTLCFVYCLVLSFRGVVYLL